MGWGWEERKYRKQELVVEDREGERETIQSTHNCHRKHGICKNPNSLEMGTLTFEASARESGMHMHRQIRHSLLHGQSRSLSHLSLYFAQFRVRLRHTASGPIRPNTISSIFSFYWFHLFYLLRSYLFTTNHQLPSIRYPGCEPRRNTA